MNSHAKNILKNKPVLVVYVLAIITIFIVMMAKPLFEVTTTTELKCYTNIGSSQLKTCGLGNYLFDAIFWVFFVILYMQKTLLPAAFVSYVLLYTLEKDNKKFSKNILKKYIITVITFLIIATIL